MNLSSEYNKKIEAHFAKIWKNNNIKTLEKYDYIVDQVYKDYLFYPEIVNTAKNCKIKFHSPCNPKSSQILALNLFLSLEDIDINFWRKSFYVELIQKPKIIFEWVPTGERNILNEAKTSNYDVRLDFGNIYYLMEIKFTERSPQPCNSSLKSDDCKKAFINIKCPLKKEYKTQYFKLLKNKHSPYNIHQLNKLPRGCPFLMGEQYQFMRYILYCYKQTGSKWIPVIMYPQENEFIEKEVNLTRALLKNQDYIKSIYLHDFVNNIKKYDPKLYGWLKERYIL